MVFYVDKGFQTISPREKNPQPVDCKTYTGGVDLHVDLTHASLAVKRLQPQCQQLYNTSRC